MGGESRSQAAGPQHFGSQQHLPACRHCSPQSGARRRRSCGTDGGHLPDSQGELNAPKSHMSACLVLWLVAPSRSTMQAAAWLTE